MALTDPSVIVISAHNDAHLPIVQQFLSKKLVVIDPLAVTAGLDLSFGHNGRHRQIIYKDEPVTDVSGVWYRKPTNWQELNLSLPDYAVAYTASALQQYAGLLRDQFPKAVWISPYHAMKRADNKSLGLYTAAACGLAIPETLFTGDPVKARRFIDGRDITIVKPLARSYPLLPDKGATMFFARRVHKGQPVDLAGLKLAPAIFQQAIDVRYDIRVSVVGGQAFASKITHREPAGSAVRDWRFGHFTGNLDFKAYASLPPDVAGKCIHLVKRLGLRFGSIDLVRDTTGGYWFLEINPNGQWGFVDQATTDRIAAALARMLEKR